MATSYDAEGNYQYPEGFDPETGEWLEGYDDQRAIWETQYAEAHARWEAHKKQVADAQAADLEAGETGNYTSSTDDEGVREAVATGSAAAPAAPAGNEGALASDEALQALREKLTGG
jgi:small subunit ribosomal protein S1